MNMFYIFLLFVTLTYSTKDIKTPLGSFVSAIGTLGRTLIKENKKHNQSFFQDRSSSPTQDEVNRYKVRKNAELAIRPHNIRVIATSKPGRPTEFISQPADEVPETTDIVVSRSERFGIENLKSISRDALALYVRLFEIENLKSIFKRSSAFILLSAIALFGSLPVESLFAGFIMTGPLFPWLISNTIDIVSIASHASPSDRNENRVLAKQNKSATIVLTTTASIFLIIFLIITSGNMPDILNLSGIFGMLLGGLFLTMN